MEDKNTGTPEENRKEAAERGAKMPLPPEDPVLRTNEAYQKLTMLGVTAFFIVVLVYNLFAKVIQYDLYAIGLGYVAVENLMRAKLYGEKKKLLVSIVAMLGALGSLAVHIMLTFGK